MIFFGMNKRYAVKAGISVLLVAICSPRTPFAGEIVVGPSKVGTASKGTYVERGRYLVRIAGCNDCHTAGYAQADGKVPEKQWLLGDRLGFRGPWGTTYPANLRLTMSRITESDWMKTAGTTKLRPPMPWFALRDMDEEDLRAIYRSYVTWVLQAFRRRLSSLRANYLLVHMFSSQDRLSNLVLNSRSRIAHGPVKLDINHPRLWQR